MIDIFNWGGKPGSYDSCMILLGYLGVYFSYYNHYSNKDSQNQCGKEKAKKKVKV